MTALPETDPSPETSPSALARRNRREWRLLGVLGLLILVLSMWLLGPASRSRSLDTLQLQLNSVADGQASLISSIRDKYRTLPAVLAQDPQLRASLAPQADAAARQALNLKLEALARETGASVLYLINAEGDAVAASNWSQPDSFVGQNYNFRPYVTDTLRDGQSEYFALGTASGRPGLYFAHRIGRPTEPDAGVVVAKLEFIALEQEWQRYPFTLFVTDADGIVILSSRADWRFLAQGPLTEARRQAIIQARPYGDAALLALPLDAADPQGLRSDGRHDQYLEDTVPIAGSQWQLHALAPTRAALARSALTARLTGVLAIIAMLALAALWLQRRQRARERTLQAILQRRELERLVALRTDALHQANRRLEKEIQAVQASRARARALREQLEQADKLSFLGQMTAGVAHELNQPLAALRLHAASSRTLVAQGDLATLADSLAAIERLTDKIGVITAQLCHYARAPADERADICVRDALDNALLLLGHRLRQQNITLDLSDVSPSLSVKAAQVRLEQVFTNLIRNAIDALAGRDDGLIQIRAQVGARVAVITVQDNGPGIAPSVRQRLFMPFASSRSDGLGLGLVISQDIIRTFGGSLQERSAPGEGACFVMTLPLSQP